MIRAQGAAMDGLGCISTGLSRSLICSQVGNVVNGMATAKIEMGPMMGLTL